MTDAEKLEILRIALRDLTYLSAHDPNPLSQARTLAYEALKAAGFIPERGHFETHGRSRSRERRGLLAINQADRPLRLPIPVPRLRDAGVDDLSSLVMARTRFSA